MPNPICNRRALGSPYPNLAAQFTGVGGSAASIADNASLSMGAGARNTIAAWVWADVASGYVVAKTQPTVLTEWAIIANAGATSFQYRVSSTGGTTFTNTVNSSTFGAIPLSTWNFLVARYDGTNLSISVNAGTVNTSAFSGDISDQANAFTFGSDAVGGTRFTGRLDAVGYWSRAITDAEVTQLYRGGVGMAYRDLDAGLKASLVSFWNLDGAFLDSHGSNHLTNGGGALFTAGKR